MPKKTGELRRKRRKSPLSKKSTYTVFVSHSSKDIWIAERMVDLIERSDAKCRIDKRDFEGGGDIWEQINNAVAESQEIVILFTPNSKSADWISFEIGAASQAKIHVTPILYGVEYKDLPIISGKIALDLNTEFNLRYMDELEKRVGAWKKGKA
jgi:hypothetical protein